MGPKERFEITYSHGVTYRRSTCFEDRMPDGRMVQGGMTLEGHAVSGADGVMYVRAAPKLYLPMHSATDKNTVYIRKHVAPAPAPASGHYGHGAPSAGYGPPPSGYPPAPPPAPPAPPAPPPSNWTEYNHQGRPYWYNETTGATTWDNPNPAPAPAPAPYQPPAPPAPYG